MRSLLAVSFVLATVTGAPEPWTVAQVLAGAPLQNAVAEGRAHNPGVITNLALHHYYPAVYGKRSAEPYTLAQVAAGAPVRNAAAEGRLHNIGVITNAADAGVRTVGGLPLAAPLHHAVLPRNFFYGKRSAEPYTLSQVAAGQTAGGVITAIDYGHGTGLQPAVAAPAVAYTHPAYAHYPLYPYYG